MQPDPTSASAAAFSAAASAISMALFGVDYYSLVWGFLGALLALTQAARMERMQAMVYVTLSTFVGAMCGSFVTDYYSLKSRLWLLALCLFFGLVAQAIVAAVFKAAPGLAAGLIGGVGTKLSKVFGGKQ